MAATINDILSALKAGEEIAVNDIVAATRGGSVTRRDLEQRLRDAGYFYAIAHDAFMPPSWVAQQRARTT